MSYPESKMNVAVHVGGGLVHVYGWERNGFRPLLQWIYHISSAAALTFCLRFNDAQRKKLAVNVVIDD